MVKNTNITTNKIIRNYPAHLACARVLSLTMAPMKSMKSIKAMTAMKSPKAPAGRAAGAKVKVKVSAKDGRGTTRTPAPKKSKIMAMKKQQSEEESVEEVLSGQVPYFDREISSAEDYSSACGKCVTGSALFVKARDEDGYKLADVLYRVHDSLDHSSGLLLEADFITSSAKVTEKFANVTRDNGKMLHLCKTSPCKMGKGKDDIIHVIEWKACSAESLSDPWISAKSVERFKQMKRKSSASESKHNKKKDDEATMWWLNPKR